CKENAMGVMASPLEYCTVITPDRINSKDLGPPQQPNVSDYDFYLWGNPKDKSYRIKPVILNAV
ncbi:hypothetical protein TNIN_25331, partial [Trichonephila inaurata madagascariensis]